MGLKRTAHEGVALREVVDRAQSRTLDGLLVLVRQGDAEQRRWAARDLVDHPQSASLLGECLLNEAAMPVCEAIFTTLKAHATPLAVSALLPLLRSERATLRNGAIEALASMPQEVAPRIAALLRDSDPDVRLFTVNLLGELQHPQVPDWLIDVVDHEPQVNVVAAAIDVLAEVGTPPHRDALQRARQRFAAEPFIAFAVDMAMHRIEGA